jgi:hypothetical protein
VVELQNLDFMFSPLMGDYLISRRYIDGNLNSCWIYACYMSFFSLLFFIIQRLDFFIFYYKNNPVHLIVLLVPDFGP